MALKYEDFFQDNLEIDFISEPNNSISNYWLQSVIIKDALKRDDFLDYLNKNGVMSRPIWKLMNELEMFKDCQSTTLTNAKYLEQRVVNITSSVIL